MPRSRRPPSPAPGRGRESAGTLLTRHPEPPGGRRRSDEAQLMEDGDEFTQVHSLAERFEVPLSCGLKPPAGDEFAQQSSPVGGEYPVRVDVSTADDNLVAVVEKRQAMKQQRTFAKLSRHALALLTRGVRGPGARSPGPRRHAVRWRPARRSLSLIHI